MRNSLLIVGVFIGIAASLALLTIPPQWPSSWLAQRIQRDWDVMAEQQVADSADQLATLGDSGLSALVDGLYHSRPAVRAACLSTLHSQLDAWQKLQPDDSAPKVRLLIQMQAERTKTALPEALAGSTELATRILNWPTLPDNIEGTRLVYACQQVLQAARTAGIYKETGQPNQAVSMPAGGMGPDAKPGNISAEPRPSDPLAVHESVKRVLVPRLVPPSPPPFQPIGLSIPADVPPAEFSQPAESAAPTVDQLIVLSEIEIFRFLADPATEKMAADELLRRGFSQRDLRLAAAWASPDANVREQLARTIPKLAGVDARSWLLLLIRDESSRVRAAAVAWLATSSDPTVQQHLRALEQTETDDQVRQALRAAAKNR